MADAGKCDTDIFDNGVVVGIVTGADAHTIEAYVKCCAERSGQPMDWHYVDGRARVLTTGDLVRAKQALAQNQMRVQVS